MRHSLKAGEAGVLPEYFLIPIVGAFIGWVTNLLAIKLIFWPLQPIEVPLAGITIQGLLPRRRKEMARLIGVTLEKEVLSTQTIFRSLVNDSLRQDITDGIGEAIRKRLQARFPVFLPRGLTEGLINYLTGLARRETAAFLDESLDDLSRQARESFHLGEMVEERLNSLDLDALEGLVVKLAASELRHIEILGGVLGFIIGMIQVIFLALTR